MWENTFVYHSFFTTIIYEQGKIKKFLHGYNKSTVSLETWGLWQIV